MYLESAKGQLTRSSTRSKQHVIPFRTRKNQTHHCNYCLLFFYPFVRMYPCICVSFSAMPLQPMTQGLRDQSALAKW